MNTSFDISDKISTEAVQVLASLDSIATQLHIPFVIIGATARDIFFQYLFSIETRRATMDLDIAVRVGYWGNFEELKKELIASNRFEQDLSQIQRLRFGQRGVVDLIPFGGTSEYTGKISWPPEYGISMSAAGFEEVLLSAVTARIQIDPVLYVKVATPAGLAILKLIAWQERYPERSKDAEDLHFILSEYIHAGNSERLYSTDKDLVEESGFDYALAGARLLGRDVHRIAMPETRNALLSILDNEVTDDSSSRLIFDMVGGKVSEETQFERMRLTLLQFKLGISEEIAEQTAN